MTEATPDASKSQPKGDGRRMTAEEQVAFLAEPHLCHLACLDDDGHPYVVPV
jgi:nitroimidazol reductase NimA-like FMN-containing flavoprotein (pyridoxamine 5'-phosphate oxidase superfamily)